MSLMDKNQSFFNVSPKTARRQKMGEMLIENSTKSEPIYGWGQGLAKLLAAGVGAYTVNEAEKDHEAERNQGYGEIMGAPEARENSTNPYTQQYNLLSKMKEMDAANEKLPKEIQILQYLEERNRKNNGGQPQPNNTPSPQANNVPLPQEQIDYATQPSTVGLNGEENLAFPQFGLLDNIDGNPPLPTNASAPRVPGTGGLLGFNDKPSPNLAPPINQPPATQPGEQMVGGPNVGRDMNDPANLYMDKILGIKPKDRMGMETSQGSQQLQLDKMQDVSNRIDTVLSQIDESDFGTGMIAGYTGDIKNSPAFKLKARIAPIIANLGFDQLMELKNAGGTLGQVAVAELENLQRSVANLEIATGEKQLKEELLSVKRSYGRLMDVKRQITGIKAPTPTAPQKPISEMSDQELEAIANGG